MKMINRPLQEKSLFVVSFYVKMLMSPRIREKKDLKLRYLCNSMNLVVKIRGDSIVAFSPGDLSWKALTGGW